MTARATPGQEALFPAAPDPDLGSYDIILASISGGKDSQTMLRLLVARCRAAGVPLERIVCVFADLGEDDEWPGTEEIARLHAAHYGLRFITVCRTVTDPATGLRRQQGLLEHIVHRGMWPDAKNRFCTADLKRGPIRTVMTLLCGELRAAWRAACPGARRARPRRVRILSVMGLRAQESVDRRLMLPFGPDEESSNLTVRQVDEWLPIHDWTLPEVWADILASGVPYHYAYDLGMPRLSCQFCILASTSALIIAARHNPRGAARRLAVERHFAWRRIIFTYGVLGALQATAWEWPVNAHRIRALKREWRSGHKFRAGLSMADVIERAQADGGPATADEWAA